MKLYDEETTPTSTPTTNNWSSSDSNDPTSPFLDSKLIVWIKYLSHFHAKNYSLYLLAWKMPLYTSYGKIFRLTLYLISLYMRYIDTMEKNFTFSFL